MSLPVVLTPDALDDIDDAYRWYEAQQPGRGNQFLIELHDRLHEIGQTPKLFGLVFRQLRAARLLRSQFVVYSLVESNRVVVKTIQHARADPRKWQRRR